jgi:hypothetical protein
MFPARGRHGETGMDQRLLVVHRNHRGCTLFDRGRPLAWYPDLAPALAMAQLLAEASALRDGPPARVELRSFGRPSRQLPVHAGQAG